MKEGIHPKYHEVEARCACGATWKTRSTKPELHLEICSNCHPFFTGRQKLIDTEGRVERFTKKFGAQTVGKPQESSEGEEKGAGRRALIAQLETGARRPRTRHFPLNPRQAVTHRVGARRTAPALQTPQGERPAPPPRSRTRCSW